MRILEVENLTFAYQKKYIFKNVSFSVNKGDFVGIIGPNGSGKSTLIKLMLGILTPEAGQIRIFGEDIRKFSEWPKIGYVSQKANSFNGDFPATVNEIVGAALLANKGLFQRKLWDYNRRINEALKKVGMQDYGDKMIGRLSGGQQQRVFIARVLVTEPEIMFLDEPTVGIDAKSEEALYCLLARLNSELGITIIMVTHDIGAITAHADKLIVLEEKGLSVHDMKDPEAGDIVSDVYGYPVKIQSRLCRFCGHARQVNN